MASAAPPEPAGANGAARRQLALLCRGRGDDLPLDLCCALIAAEESAHGSDASPGEELDPTMVLEELDALASGLSLVPEAGVYDSTARLCHHLFVEEGFLGDREHYDEPRCSLIDRVLETRRGLPILLCIIAMEVGRRVGFELEGVGFPGHFLVAPTNAEPRFWLDPFHGGQVLTREQLRGRLARLIDRPVDVRAREPRPRASPAISDEELDGHARAVSARFVLLRVNNNLKGAFLRKRDVAGALRAVERLLLLEPRLQAEQRDRGLMLAHLGRPEEGLEALGEYLRANPDAEDRGQVLEAMSRIGARPPRPRGPE